jgi:hypothetical protein
MADTKPKVGSQMRITTEDMQLIKGTFANNEPLLKLLRKIFLPELDPTTPIGQNIDLWMTVSVDNMTAEQALVNLKARNILINHVEQQLMQLKLLSEVKEETAEELSVRMEKDNNK